MPTLPPHQARAFAESFGADPQRYDRRIAAGGPDVVDVGIGTGIVARQLRDASCRVLGVEIDPRTAAVALADGFVLPALPFNPFGRSIDAVGGAFTMDYTTVAVTAIRL